MADIVQLLEKFRYDISRTMKVALPGKIEDYDYKTQKANIKIDIQELYKNGDTLDCPVIGGVPIIFPSSGGAFFTMPVKRGDLCWIMFADRDITRWLFNGRGLPCESVRSHDLNDAVAIMGLHPFINVFNLENNDDVVISYSGSRVTIKPDGVFNINTTKDVNINAAKNLNIETGDNTNISAKGNVSVNSEKNVNVQAKQDVNVEAAKNVNLTSDEVTNITAKSNINITTDKVLNIVAAEDVNFSSDMNINITSKEDINVSSKNITIDNAEAITINTKNSVVNATETVTVSAHEIILKAGDESNPQNVNVVGNLNVSEKLTVEKGIENRSKGIKNVGGIANRAFDVQFPNLDLGEGISNHGLLPADGIFNNKGFVNSGGIANYENANIEQLKSFSEGPGISNHVGSIKNSGALGIINEVGGIENIKGGIRNLEGGIRNFGRFNNIGVVLVEGETNLVGFLTAEGGGEFTGAYFVNGVPIV